MSTSEFDRQWEEEDLDFSSLLNEELRQLELPGIPGDFSEEDIAFAREMEVMFSPDSEEMPPFYVQTLLEAESPRFQPVEEGIEYKTKAQVFRRLRLRRRLFPPSTPLHFGQGGRFLSRPIIALVTACLLFMVVTMVATSSSFASGLAVLMAGPHSGAMLVNGYPQHYTRSSRHLFDADIADPAGQIDLLSAQQQIAFTPYQPSYVPDNYILRNVSMYPSSTGDWANGPIMEMDYSYTYPGSRHQTAQISICEFKPNGQVYQVVQVGAAHYVQLGSDNSVRAVYVDGQWMRVNKFTHNWVYGSRSEIIYEHDGVVFWIAADASAGVNQDTLLTIAKSLQPLDARAIHLGAHINVTVADDSTNWPFANDVVYANGSNGSSLEVVGADLSSAGSRAITNMQVAQ